MAVLINYDPITLHYTPVDGLENKSMTFVTLGDAARFCNWEEHGEPTREAVTNYSSTHSLEITEEGAYTFTNNEHGVIVIPVVQQFVCKLVALGLFDFSTSVSC